MHRRILVGMLACVVAAGILLADAASAWAPPAEGFPNMGVSRSCVQYGHRFRVEGFGFAPGSTVRLSAPEGHYTGPPFPSTVINDVSVRANDNGGFRGSLKAPPAPPGEPWSWQARVVFATGTPEVGEGEEEGQSFDQVVIGTRRVCRTLEQGRGRR